MDTSPSFHSLVSLPSGLLANVLLLCQTPHSRRRWTGPESSTGSTKGTLSQEKPCWIWQRPTHSCFLQRDPPVVSGSPMSRRERHNLLLAVCSLLVFRGTQRIALVTSVSMNLSKWSPYRYQGHTGFKGVCLAVLSILERFLFFLTPFSIWPFVLSW